MYRLSNSFRLIMTTKYIFPHFGLGDAIIINGLVRHFCSIYDSVVYFSSDIYFSSIKYMFRDLKNLNVINFGDLGSVFQNCKNFISNNGLENDVIEIGYEKLYHECNHKNPGTPFYKGFYTMFDMDPLNRFDNFLYERNFDYEDYVFNYLNPKNEEYIFIIDDPEHHLGNLKINEEKIKNNFKIIKYNKRLNYNDERFLLFNYGKIIENAKEVHSVETGFLEFIFSMNYDVPVYIHSYLRNYIDRKDIPKTKNFHIVDI